MLYNYKKKIDCIESKKTYYLLRAIGYCKVVPSSVLANYYFDKPTNCYSYLNRMMKYDLLKVKNLTLMGGRKQKFNYLSNDGAISAELEPYQLRQSDFLFSTHRYYIQTCVCTGAKYEFELEKDNSTIKPDIVLSKDGNRIAIEVETSFKNTKRYKKKMQDYILAMKKGKYDLCVYVLLTDNQVNKMYSIFNDIRYYIDESYNRKSITENERSLFKFAMIDEFDNYIESVAELIKNS